MNTFQLAKVTTQLLVAATSAFVGFKLGSRPPSADDSDDEFKAEETPVAHASKDPVGNTKEGTLDNVEEASDGDLAAIKAGFTEQCKLVLVVRTDLKMSPGDISTQCATATLACFKALESKNPALIKHWERTGQAKIALKGKSEEQLLELEAIAKSLNLCARVVHNEQLTRSAEETCTVLGIGPAPVPLINQVTGTLRLL